MYIYNVNATYIYSGFEINFFTQKQKIDCRLKSHKQN